MAELSHVSVVLIIAIGMLVFIICFILSKRQIVRFALKSTRRPHVPIGSGAPKTMRLEIERRLERVGEIHVDPVLWTERVQQYAVNTPDNHFHYRMKALDAFSNAMECLRASFPDMARQGGTQSVLQYLFTLCPNAANTHDAVIIRQFSLAYQLARHDPRDFGEPQFINYMEILDQIIRLVKSTLEKGRSPLADTEVVIRPGKHGYSDGVIFVQQTKPRYNTSTNQNAQQIRQRSRGDGAETIPLADSGLSSGSSSIRPPSSGHGSSENLVVHGGRPAEQENSV